ncbi:unnamed protein product [Dibothriocephalus latus]|uniref:Uncharacterized protein n=1 Tax=Dibothriocephalus latus TaxID=60516 RepID=A0A3P6TFR3_DIBLA|nr:unnamed protein product [Dibothriocephalus latus]
MTKRMTDRGTSSLPVEHQLYGSAAGTECQSTRDFYPANIPLQAYNTDGMNLPPGSYSLQSCGASGAEQPEENTHGPPQPSPVLYKAAAAAPKHMATLGVEAELYEGLRVNSATEFEVILFLNQMGVFNFVDDGSVPGGAVLKLSDGRKRSMSLWVEFITASGYLSARKIRVRFHSLVAQAIDKCTYRGILQLVGQHSEVRIRIRDRYTLQITPAFRCQGLWPRSASHWPTNNRSTNPNVWMVWPPPRLISEVKHEGFTLLSQESTYIRDKQTSAEGDAWLLDFYEAEESLLNQGSRQLCLNILTTLVERHLASTSEEGSQQHPVDECYGAKMAGEGPPLIHDYYIKTLVLHECEKHPQEEDWTEYTIPDRISGILLQLISCLQHRHCPHYFLPQLNLFRRQTPSAMELAARRTWGLLRTLITCPTAFERL